MEKERFFGTPSGSSITLGSTLEFFLPRCPLLAGRERFPPPIEDDVPWRALELIECCPLTNFLGSFGSELTLLETVGDTGEAGCCGCCSWCCGVGMNSNMRARGLRCSLVGFPCTWYGILICKKMYVYLLRTHTYKNYTFIEPPVGFHTYYTHQSTCT